MSLASQKGDLWRHPIEGSWFWGTTYGGRRHGSVREKTSMNRDSSLPRSGRPAKVAPKDTRQSPLRGEEPPTSNRWAPRGRRFPPEVQKDHGFVLDPVYGGKFQKIICRLHLFWKNLSRKLNTMEDTDHTPRLDLQWRRRRSGHIFTVNQCRKTVNSTGCSSFFLPLYKYSHKNDKLFLQEGKRIKEKRRGYFFFLSS